MSLFIFVAGDEGGILDEPSAKLLIYKAITLILLVNSTILASRKYKLLLLLISVFLIMILRNRYDYSDYMVQWQNFLLFNNPSGAYGPLHNLVAYLSQIDEKLPRFLFSTCSLLASFFLYDKVNQHHAIDDEEKRRIRLLLILNPLVWIFFVIFGCNDGLVGAMFLFGIAAYDKQRFVLAAFLLSIAIFYKYIPLFVLPFLCFNQRKINWKFSLPMGGFMVAGIAMSWLAWGEKFLGPVLFNAQRESKLLSIFRYLRGDYSFLKFFNIEHVDYLSTYLTVSAVIIVFIVHVIFNLKTYQSIILALASVFLFYKVGHFQFYFSLILILIYYYARHYQEIKRNYPMMLETMWLFVLWISVATLMYGILNGFSGEYRIIREIIGLPTFLIGLSLISTCIGLVIKVKTRRVVPSMA